MDFRKLRYFVAVAEEGSFTRAAERLHISQPPLSRQIQQLELGLGVELFDRKTNPLQLTPVGRLLLSQAQQILARFSQIQDMVDDAIKSNKRHFRIGFVGSTIFARLPPLIREFRLVLPDVELQLFEMTSMEQAAALKNGQIDVGYGRIRFEDDIITRVILRREPLVAAIPVSHILADESTSVSLSRIALEPLIVYPNHQRPNFTEQVLELFSDHGLKPQVAHEAVELQTAMGLVAAEEGLCIVPESVSKSRGHDVFYRPLSERPTSPIIMSYHPDRISTELRHIASVNARMYKDWGYDVPAGLQALVIDTDEP